MTNKGVSGPEDTGLSDAIDRYSATGLMVRYARGRVGYLAQRQMLTLLGAAALWLVDGPGTAAIAIALALLGETVDCLYLRGLPGRLERGASLGRAIWLSTGTATFQAITISLCVGLSWYGRSGAISPLFSIAFLAGAAINAGIVLPYNRPAALARLGVYGLAALAFYSSGAVRSAENLDSLPLNIAGMLILAYMVAAFIDFVVRGFNRQRKNILALAEQGQVIASAHSELQTRERETQRLATAVRHANDSVVICGPDGRITWVNEAFARITGYSLAEAMGRFPGDLLNDDQTDPKVIAAIADAVARGVPFRGEVLNRTKSGELKWIETNQFPVSATGCEGKPDMFVAIERDITEAKRQEQLLAEAKSAAEEGGRAKSEFLATMSHEIRTPMNAVIGMADLLCDSPLNDDQRVYADTIRASSQALLDIINDVLDLSKLDAGKMQIHSAPFDLHQCLDSVIQLMQTQALDKGLALCSEFDESLPQWVLGDEGRIRQVMVNLLGNSLKFTPTGSVTLRAGSRLTPEGLQICLSVIDTGIGIDEDKLDAIFESFSQAEAATTRRFGGTGLGLTISRRLVEAMGGEISAKSKPDEGSCFSVSLQLPRALPPPDAKAGRLVVGEAAEVAFDGLRVLVAEDNKVNRLLVDKYLAGLDIELHFAHDGKQAVEMTQDIAPDLILMDMSMPVMNGLDATRKIRRAPGPQPVIVALTANAFASDRAACLAVGMDGFLTKPVRRAELIECLGQYRPGVALTAQA